VNASLGGTHCDIFTIKTTHTTSRSSLCWVSISAGLHFLGYTGLRARHLYFYALLHSRRWLAALPSSCFRAPGNLYSLEKLRFTASQKSERTGLSMVMRAHAAMFPMKQRRFGLDTTSTNGTFFFLLLEPKRVPWWRWLVNATNPTTFSGSNPGIDIRTGGISHRTGCERLAVRDCAGVRTSVMSRWHTFRSRVSER